MTEPTIQDQIDLEKRSVAYGIARYQRSVECAEQNDRGADTTYAQKLMQEFIAPVSASISEFCSQKGPGVKAKYRVLLSTVNADTAAYLGLRAVLNHFTKEEPLATLSIQIGTMLEDEAKFKLFQSQHGDYYDAIIRDFENKGTKSYRHMHRVLTMKAKEHNIAWESWTTAEKSAVGIKVIDCILESTDLIAKKEMRVTKGRKTKVHTIIVPTAECLDWINRYKDFAMLLHPDRVPCVIPPDPWVNMEQGGYYTPQLRGKTQLVKTRSKQHAKLFNGDLTKITEAVNTIQNVAWRINHEVLDVLKTAWDKALPIGLPQSEPYTIPTCPVEKSVHKRDMTTIQREAFDEWKAEARIVHTMERERVSKCFQVIRVLRLANEFSSYNQFWFVYQCDFRGRIYATVSGMSPQGADFAKALLHFAEGKPLGERGLHWLKIHGANCFGNDKLPYKDRVAWVDSVETMILRIAADPLSTRNEWADCDKPWQFLAFCFEYARYKSEGIGMLSYLPIGLDGSCNGLQNFSAMLRDEVGGKATNLVPGKAPNDIYTEVAQRCTERLRANPCEMASIWLAYANKVSGGTLPRGLSKRPVMTLPYGSTRQSCREYIYKWMLEDAPDDFPKEIRFKLSVFLTPILWASIGDVVVAARHAMDWIQRCAGALSKEKFPLVWWTPMGFPVLQDRKKVVSRQIHTELAGHFRLRLSLDSNELDVSKQKLGASPNFVHSYDACHLMMTVHRAAAAGLTSFAFIHDDYGTHACDTDVLHQCIREAFVELYTDNNPLKDFKEINEAQSGLTLPDIPKSGTLNLNEIKESEYFFG